MEDYSIAFVANLLLGWLVGISILLVGYLFSLQIRDLRRHHRMEAERERLGLKPSRRTARHRANRPKFYPSLPVALAAAAQETNMSMIETAAVIKADNGSELFLCLCPGQSCRSRNSTPRVPALAREDLGTVTA